jgi:hypothetical protein
MILQAKTGISAKPNGTSNGAAHAEASSGRNGFPVPDIEATPVPTSLPQTPAPFTFDQPAADSSPSPIRGRRRVRGSRWEKAAILLVLVGIAGTVAYTNWDKIRTAVEQAGLSLENPGSAYISDQPDTTPPPETNGGAPPPPKPVEPPPTLFPRRMLAISVNNYWYANPVNYGSLDENPTETLEQSQRVRKPDRSFHAVVQRLSEAMHIPPSEVFELSDVPSKNEAVPPLKQVLESTITQFLETCRAQDRIMLLFIGHVVEIGEDCYLVPIEGELGVKESLIPLKWLYDNLAKCKAQQKVLIMDVCRFNPSRGLERPGTGPMGAKLEATLKNPPPGVQLWSACSQGEFSYEGAIELPDRSLAITGYFINEIFEAVGSFRKKVNTGIQKPEDPFPLEVLMKGEGTAKGVHGGTTFEVFDWYQAKQIPFFSGTPSPTTVPYDSAEPLATAIAIKAPEPAVGPAAPRSLVQGILDDTEGRLTREGSLPMRVETLPLYANKMLSDYVDDGERTPFRQAVIKATDLLKKHAQTFKEDFRGNGNDNTIKELIRQRQQKPARAFSELMDELDNLKKAGENRKEEKSKRWLANYDYILAKLEARLAYVYEYNYMLGQIRKDSLPPRDPAKHSGWRLASRETLSSGSEAKKLANDAKKILTAMAKAHEGTPYEIMAKRQLLTALGLEWKPTP